jgi:hypothetical protein
MDVRARRAAHETAERIRHPNGDNHSGFALRTANSPSVESAAHALLDARRRLRA